MRRREPEPEPQPQPRAEPQPELEPEPEPEPEPEWEWEPGPGLEPEPGLGSEQLALLASTSSSCAAWLWARLEPPPPEFGSGSTGICSWELWVEGFISGKTPWGGWLQQNKEWWDACQQQLEQVLWTTFEDCVEKPAQEVRRIADFLGVQLPAEQMEQTARAITFAEMNQRYGPQHPFLHKGKPGQHRDYFSPAELERFNALVVHPALEYGMRLRLSAPLGIAANADRV